MASLIWLATPTTSAPLSTEAARIFRIWLVSTSMPRPDMKPTSTARERKLARNASRKYQKTRNNRPHITANAPAYCDTQRVPGRGEGQQGCSHQRGDRGIRAANDMARRGEQGKDHQRNDSRIQANDRWQTRDLGIPDIQRNHQGRQRDAGGCLARHISPTNPAQTGKRLGPTGCSVLASIVRLHASPRLSDLLLGRVAFS